MGNKIRFLRVQMSWQSWTFVLPVNLGVKNLGLPCQNMKENYFFKNL